MHQARLVTSPVEDIKGGSVVRSLTRQVDGMRAFSNPKSLSRGRRGKKEYAEHVSHAGGMWPCANCQEGPTHTEF